MNTADIGALHVITDETVQDRFSHEELARHAAAGGADVVQFREKRPRPASELIETATRIAKVLEGTSTRLVVDDHVEVALRAGVYAVHLGRRDLEPAKARKILGTSAIVGGTANSLDEAVRVAASPVDYLGVGPVYGTRSKTNPAPILGIDALRAIVRAVPQPVIAIGNITVERVDEVLDTGAHGIAVLAAVVRAPDPREATRALRVAVERCRLSRSR